MWRAGAPGGPRLSFVERKYGENLMAKLRHIAIQVPDLEKAAAFYEGVFELKRVNKVDSPIGNAIALSDGIVNLTLLHFPEGTKGARVGRIGPVCITSALSSKTKRRRRKKSSISAANSSCSCRTIRASTPRRSSRIRTASSSMSPNTTGINRTTADAHRRRQGANHTAERGGAECAHQLRRYDGDRARDRHRRPQQRQSAYRPRLRFDRPL